MDTILIIRDSVASCVKKTAEICQPCVKEIGTSWQDVVMTGLMYAFILCLVYLLLNGFLKWWNQMFLAKTKRKHEIEDRKSKQRADLEEKLLSHLKDRAEKKIDKDGKEIPKFDKEASNAYMERLDQMLKEDGSKPKEQNDEEASKPNGQNDQEA